MLLTIDYIADVIPSANLDSCIHAAIIHFVHLSLPECLFEAMVNYNFDFFLVFCDFSSVVAQYGAVFAVKDAKRVSDS